MKKTQRTVILLLIISFVMQANYAQKTPILKKVLKDYLVDLTINKTIQESDTLLVTENIQQIENLADNIKLNISPCYFLKGKKERYYILIYEILPPEQEILKIDISIEEIYSDKLDPSNDGGCSTTRNSDNIYSTAWKVYSVKYNCDNSDWEIVN